jgi:hypothetical protein
VKHGAELLNDDNHQPVEAVKVTTVAVLKKRAMAAGAGR